MEAINVVFYVDNEFSKNCYNYKTKIIITLNLDNHT